MIVVACKTLLLDRLKFLDYIPSNAVRCIDCVNRYFDTKSNTSLPLHSVSYIVVFCTSSGSVASGLQHPSPFACAGKKLETRYFQHAQVEKVVGNPSLPFLGFILLTDANG